MADFNTGLLAYQNGDYSTVLKEWMPLAEQGNSNAQTNLGHMYKYGEGVVQDSKTAANWLTRAAAEQGHASAQLNLGLMYEYGDGVLQDYNVAVKWYTLSAEQGYAAAQYSLGAMYYNGVGVPPDINTAAKWFNLSAAQGYSGAAKVLTQLNLAKSEAPEIALDSVVSPIIASESSSSPAVGIHSLDIFVNVLGNVMFLKDLKETVTGTSHSIEYNGQSFVYSEIASIITTVVRDDEFTAEFAQEITDAYPSSAGTSYLTALALLGQSNLDATLMTVAGADGNYVG